MQVYTITLWETTLSIYDTQTALSTLYEICNMQDATNNLGTWSQI